MARAGAPDDAEEQQAEIGRFLDAWVCAIVDADAQTAARLRLPTYRLCAPDGRSIDWAEEVAMIGAGTPRPSQVRIDQCAVTLEGAGAARVELTMSLAFEPGATTSARYRCLLELVKEKGDWAAKAASLRDVDPLPASSAGGRPWRTLAAKVGRRLGAWTKRRAGRAGFPDLAYIPFRSGKSFLLPASERAEKRDGLPVPPKHLWLGYNYPLHGKLHVDTMLKAVEESGLTLGSGDRILDLGCGAGRMIRHLEPLAGDCEIWGTDISAEHIFWCKQHLSPPFRFATTTKVPSLPFEDRSFALIYCGSLFTHIDDLADAWLLELHRILAPEGRLYVTIHDEHTVRLMDEPRYGWSPYARGFKAHPLFAEARKGFGMLALGRDDRSQIFYERNFFTAMTDRMFETLAILEEAYFYQTALVLKRRTRREAAGG